MTQLMARLSLFPDPIGRSIACRLRGGCECFESLCYRLLPVFFSPLGQPMRSWSCAWRHRVPSWKRELRLRVQDTYGLPAIIAGTDTLTSGRRALGFCLLVR